MGIAHSNDYAKSRNGPKIALGQFWLLKWAACAIDCSPPDHHNVNARIIQFNLLLAFSAMCSTLHFEIKHQDQEPRTQSCANKTCSWGKGVSLGAQSFEHANVLSEKINFLALGGPEVAIFGPDDLHTMY